MEIKRLVVGQLQTNCYFVWDKKSKEAIVIDPADEGNYIANKIQDLNLKPKLIVATHGHVDHVLAVTELKLIYKIPFLLHRADLFLVKRMRNSAKYWFGVEADPPPKVNKFIKEGELIRFGKEKLKVIETPGHSPGGVALFGKHHRGEERKHLRGGAKTKPVSSEVKLREHLGGETLLFSGDTLFRQGVGRTDFSYASEEELMNSIKKLFKLPENTKVHPGHGEETTLKAEKSSFTFEKFPIF